MTFHWTEEASDTACQMWLQGASSSAIASEIGASTRMCVVGKIYRMGLSGQGPPSNATKRKLNGDIGPARKRRRRKVPPKPAAAPRPLPQRALRSEPPPILVPVREPPPPPVACIPVNIDGLTPHTCRWPLWSDYARPAIAEKLYCGEVREAGPYCIEHADKSTNARAA